MQFTRVPYLISVTIALGVFFGFFLTSSAFAQTFDDLDYGTDAALEIVTWNIEWFPKDGGVTVDYVSDIIENLDADVLAIQEIDDTTAFKNMVDGLVNFDWVMMNGWFGGLVYVYNTERVEVLDAYEIYTDSPFWNPLPRSPLVLKFKHQGEILYAINNHYKCCGDGNIDLTDDGDEEMRRLTASELIESYVNEALPENRVIVLGDLNDLIDEPSWSNVFQPFLALPDAYQFADMSIATGPVSGWSYPSWPSHLDHILLTNELFEDFEAPGALAETLDLAAFMPGGWNAFDTHISDHRPVGLRIVPSPVGVSETSAGSSDARGALLEITDLLGRRCDASPGQFLLYRYSNGAVVRRVQQ